METLFKVNVFETIYGDGLFTQTSEGRPVTVEGAAMVKLPHGVIVDAAGFVADKAEAQRVAADRVEEIGRRIIAQAQRMRGG